MPDLGAFWNGAYEGWRALTEVLSVYYSRTTPVLLERVMVREITLRQVGGSIGATLPKDMADRLHLAVGDRVLAVETERGILLSPYDPDVETGLALAADAAKKFRNALRELAK